jgi:hypothetical protein
MKRSLVIVLPLALLVLISACNMMDNARLPKYSTAQWTAIAMTQQTMGQSKTDRIKLWMNKAPTDINKFDLLEQGLVGKYELMSVSFPTDYYFEVDMNCTCATGSNCCDPERMFFLTVQKLAASQAQILAEVPATVQYLDVVCYDRQMPFYAIYAPWQQVKDFLSLPAPDVNNLIGSISGRSMP